MKIGMSTACFYNDLEVEDVVTLYNDIGITHAEVFLNCESEYSPEFIDELKKRKGALKIHSIHAHTSSFEPELFSSHLRTAQDAEKTFRLVCRAGFELGAKYFTFHGPFHKVGRQMDVDMGRFSARMNQLCDIASSYGMHIALENVSWAVGNKLEFFAELLPLCSELKTTLDLKQAWFIGPDPIKFLEVMGDRLVTIHVCDVDKTNLPTMPFKGKYNMERFFKELKKYPNIDPAILIEVYRSNFDDIDELKNCHDKLKSLIESIK